MHKKKDIKIHPYEGDDAFYSGSDEEYEEFLKSAELSVDYGKEAESVENTQKVNLNDTINIQHVIERFRKTAGGLGHTARTVKDSFVSKMDAMKAKKEEDTQSQETEGIRQEQESEAEEKQKSVQAPAGDTAQAPQTQIVPQVNVPAFETEQLEAVITNTADKLGELVKKLDELDARLTESAKENAENSETIQDTIDAVGDGIAEIRQAVGSVSRLNDSVFDLKNTQMNTKNSISGLETSFARLKRKCVLGVTVISILCAIIIALEVLLLLS